MNHFLSRALAVAASASVPCFAAAALKPGDIAIIGFNFVNPDEIAFVALTDLAAGEEIKFTDNGWKADDTFRAGEGTFSYVVPVGGITAGTVVTPAVSGALFATTGDQILAYQGLPTAPTFLYALNAESAEGFWQADADSAATSRTPLGLTDGITAVSLVEIDGATFNTAVLASGTKKQWLAQIGAQTNWTGVNDPSRVTLPSGPIVVNAPVSPAPTDPISTFSFAGSAGSEPALGPDAQPAGATTSLITRGIDVGASAFAGAFSGNSFTTGAFSPTDFFEFSIAADAGNLLSLTKLELDERRSATGIRNWEVRSSLDNFGSALASFSVPDDTLIRTNQTILLGPAFSAIQGVQFRIYGYAAEAGTGTWWVDNVEIFGTVLVPEPALAAIAPMALLLLRRRRA